MMEECDVKGQEVRLLDVFVLGPFMVWFGAKAKDMPPAAKAMMISAGVATIIFNGINLLRLRHQADHRK